ncbi:MAG: sulfurtransferase [Burkholderiales bacterium]|nr:sulfurtransferase [Burkholderiales bacterium]
MHTTIVSPAELEPHLEDPRWVVLDVRANLRKPDWGREEYEHEHIPGARYLHIDDDLSAPKTGANGRHPLPDRDAIAATLGRAGVDETKQVVVYDQNEGAFAARCWWTLQWLGHEAVAVLDGGWARWMREQRPHTDRPTIVAPASFRVRGSRPVVDAADVLAHLDDRRRLLLDARSPERFRGESEPFDPVAGRIPGSTNRPVNANLAPDGSFRPSGELRQAFVAALAGRDPGEVVHACGSGVTACHNLLAMEIAGLPGGKLYPGSWSEWCADPARPRASGPE